MAQSRFSASRAQDKIAPNAAVVTVFCDDNKKYLSTALMHDEPVREDYLTPHIELLGLGTVEGISPRASSLTHS